MAAILAIILGSLLNKLLVRRTPTDWYWNSFFLYVLVWKFSYILINPKMFLNMPFSAIYFDGGTKGHLLALIIVSIYLLFFAVKKHISIYEESAQMFLFYFFCYEIIINSLEKNIVESFIHLILLLSFLFILISFKKKQKAWIQVFLMVMLIELLMISLFDTLLSLEGLIFSWIGIIVLLLSNRNARRTRN